MGRASLQRPCPAFISGMAMTFRQVGADQRTMQEWAGVESVKFENKVLTLYGCGVPLVNICLQPGEFVWGMDMPGGPEFVGPVVPRRAAQAARQSSHGRVLTDMTKTKRHKKAKRLAARRASRTAKPKLPREEKPKTRRQELFEESIAHFKAQNANIPAYQKRVEQLTKDGADQIAAARRGPRGIRQGALHRARRQEAPLHGEAAGGHPARRGSTQCRLTPSL